MYCCLRLPQTRKCKESEETEGTKAINSVIIQLFKGLNLNNVLDLRVSECFVQSFNGPLYVLSHLKESKSLLKKITSCFCPILFNMEKE